MKKKLFKTLSITVATTIVVSTVGPSFVSAKVSASSLSSESLPTLPSLDISYENYDPDMFDLESPTFKQDVKKSESIIQQEIHKNQEEISTQGVLGVGLKGIKAFGNVVKNGGHMLSWVLKPFSKKYSDAVKRNTSKIAKALAKPEKASRSYIKKRLMDFDIPKDDAELITKIIFWII
ncbi:hypothetical protein [Ornithinibacillus scapharcae]|uniref:hypothetical protein n=1 Tax=Ornithinibacillus scapharcae TaxID=1147159 RepID=UPI000225B831|nr:hypothetical protein [Ornithinibacillus scapharcae]